MDRVVRIVRELLTIGTFATVVGLFLAVSLVVSPNTGLQALKWTAVFAAAVLALGLIALRVAKAYDQASSIVLVRNFKQAPAEYTIAGHLRYGAARQALIEIVARTCFRWLCGDETLIGDEAALAAQQDDLHSQIRETLKGGGRLRFILQNPNVAVPFFDAEKSRQLRRHALASLRSYRQLKGTLPADLKPRLSLSITSAVVDNSMVRFTSGTSLLRFVYDISVGFRRAQADDEAVSKPFLVFNGATSGAEVFGDEFDAIVRKSVDEEVFFEKEREGRKALAALVDDYGHFSPLRQDRADRLAPIAARNFLADEKSPLVEHREPPVCVQVLVTNRCTTPCTSCCDHHRLYNQGGKHELSDTELVALFRCIHSLGTRAVVVSGGEPLARPGLFHLLAKASEIGLNVGLLTNGVLADGKGLGDREARNLARSCRWIQVSIDSFDRETYKAIRGADRLESALESVRILDAVRGRVSLEVCFTIQQQNLQEVEALLRSGESPLPESVPIRFKFAHGPTGGRDFLCRAQDLRGAVETGEVHQSRFNFDYLLSMLQRTYFTIDDISNGTPVKSLTDKYAALGYRCHALSLSCKIDPTGEVYPCCFLFDDNLADSQRRRDYSLGNVRSGVRVVPPEPGRNALASIWHGERLHSLRQQRLPIDAEACTYCTRHFYQNEFLNRLTRLMSRYADYGLAQHLMEKAPEVGAGEPIWL